MIKVFKPIVYALMISFVFFTAAPIVLAQALPPVAPIAPLMPNAPIQNNSPFGHNPNTVSWTGAGTEWGANTNAPWGNTQTQSSNVQAASCDSSVENLTDIINFLGCFINRSIIPLIFSVALAGFFFGVVRFVLGGNDETKRKEGRQYMLWGIISIFVMVSIWGILLVLTNTFGLSTFGIPQF